MNYQGSRLRSCRAHSSAAEHLLCKEEALGSNPSGSIRRGGFEPCPLSAGRRSNPTRRQMHHPGSNRGWEGSIRPPLTTLGASMTPRVRAIQASTGLVQFNESQRRWLLRQLVNCSARKLKTDVPSCEKPEGAARRPRTQDLPMRISSTIATRNEQPRELKHLSIGRTRKRNVMSSVTASERDTAQTEAHTRNVVFGLTLSNRPSHRSPLEQGVIQGDNPVREATTLCVSSGVAGVGNPSRTRQASTAKAKHSSRPIVHK